MLGLRQKTIARLAGAESSTISRGLSKANISPISMANGKNLRYSIEDVRYFFDSNIFKDKKSTDCKVLSFYNFKGGTGKTSISYQISTHLAIMGFSVLVVDVDPQGHLSTSMGFDNSSADYPTLADVFSQVKDIEECIVDIFPGLSCIPANLSLTKLEVLLNDLPKREERFCILFEKIKSSYDFIIFDTNPTISLLNRNVLVFSDLVSIICETQPYSLNGLKLLMEDMLKFYKNMQIEMPELLLVPNKYEDRTTSSAEAMSLLRRHYGEIMIPDFAVRKSEEFNTSAKLSQPLACFSRSNSIALEDISDLLHHIIQMLSITDKFSARAA